MDKGPVKNLNILLACMPKSGSTFLSHVISLLPQMRRESIVPGFHRREQEIEESRIIDCRKRTAFLRKLHRQDDLVSKARPLGWIAQHHTRFSEPTGKLLAEYNIKPVVLVRNIFDVVPSLHDHLTQDDQVMSMAYVEYGQTYAPEVFIEFIAEMAIPWYFNFYVSWKTQADVPMVTYEDLVRDPATVIHGLMDRWNAGITRNEVDVALEQAQPENTRKNKGISGRGETLPPDIRRKIESYANFYPTVDFTPIGL